MEDENLVKLLVNGDVDPSDVSDKLKICALRKKIYTTLHVKDTLSQHVNLIRYLLSIEMNERSKDQYDDDTIYEDTYDYECFYWCIFLLSRVGDVTDVKILWKAKYIDFDSSFGVDIQFLVGAGVNNTISFLEHETDQISEKILKYILNCKNCGDFDDLDKWYHYRHQYFLDIDK